MALYARKLTETEERQLRIWLIGSDATMQHRARVVFLSSQGYRVPEIGPLVHCSPANLRKWIHRFNRLGCEGLNTVHSGGPRLRFTMEQRQGIVALAQTNPRDLGFNFSRWTLHQLAAKASERQIVERISHECVRQILHDAHCDYRGARAVSAACV
jgi:transposase